MAKDNKPARKKVKKTVVDGIAHIHASFNNTIITITDRQGNALSWATAGGSGFRGSRKSTPFAARLAAEDAVKKAMGMGIREARFYQELAAEVPALTMQSFYSNWSGDGTRYLMVMEDIRARGGRPANGREDRTLEVAEQLMDTLGAMHGRYWNSPRFEKELAWLEPFSVRSTYGKALVGQALKNLGAQMPAVFTEACGLYVFENEALADLFECGTPTLIHGDLHLGNLFRDREGQVGFFDWALVAKMPGMWDVSYVICNSFSPEFRREHQRALLERYISRLAAADGGDDE